MRSRSQHVSSKASSRKSTHPSRRRRIATANGDEVARTPDTDELRRLRTNYYRDPSSTRRRTYSSNLTKSKSKDIMPSIMRSQAASSSDKRQNRRHKTRPRGAGEDETSSSRRRTEEYVYGRNAVPPQQQQEVDGEERSRTRSTARRSTGSSYRRGSLRVVKEEVTPEESISQVGERRLSERSRQTSNVQSSVRTRSTATPQLRSISEGDEISKRPRTVSHRSSQRDSTIIGSLLRRNSTPATPATPSFVDCLTCGSDTIPRTQSAKLACGHRMCHDCLKRIFQMSVKDPAHMPPKCCTDQHIPLKHVERLFDLKFKMLWNRKYQEYHTNNRVYCSNAKCGAWIKPTHFHTSRGRKYAQCPRCQTRVCATCNNKLHKSQECPKDPEMIKLTKKAKEEGWQTCFNCNAMVELKEGCNHMTCRCQAEFCMVCGSRWKTCDCPWFNYSNLPNPDRLNDMMVPEHIQVLYRRVLGAAAGQHAGAGLVEEEPNQRRRAATYTEERDQRRRQERLDEDLARRLQLATLMENDDEPAVVNRRGGVETWGLGNAAGHFMNDDYVQNAANVVMAAFGDPAFGRRGERASGRRRRAAQRPQNQGDAGLVPNFLGDESVLGAEPAGRGST